MASSMQMSGCGQAAADKGACWVSTDDSVQPGGLRLVGVAGWIGSGGHIGQLRVGWSGHIRVGTSWVSTDYSVRLTRSGQLGTARWMHWVGMARSAWNKSHQPTEGEDNLAPQQLLAPLN